jgi:hypothetical protein
MKIAKAVAEEIQVCIKKIYGEISAKIYFLFKYFIANS